MASRIWVDPDLGGIARRDRDQQLGDLEREDLRRWYWCNVFLERYSSAVESKSRKDYLELTRHWFEGGPEPDVFVDAGYVIGAPGFRIHDSASPASARYSGMFCLLALNHARDWRLAENLQLQELQDHHIFPKAFLKRHSLVNRVRVNTIANRTLISDGTNGMIKDKAPAEYTSDERIFPSGATPELLGPHFIDEGALRKLQAATEPMPDDQLAVLYAEFIQARQAAMIDEIRQACGITDASGDVAPDDEPDELAADVAEQVELNGLGEDRS